MPFIVNTCFWKEKAKMLWFKDGERNTAFFHVVVKIKI